MSAKRLVAGDSVLFIWYTIHFSRMYQRLFKKLPFVILISIKCTTCIKVLFQIFINFDFCFPLIRNDKNQLLLGIRRANRPQTVMPSSVLSSDSMHLGLLAAAAHAAATISRFTIFYNPRYVPFSR